MGEVIFEDVVIDGLISRDELNSITGAAFKHVVLKGVVGGHFRIEADYPIVQGRKRSRAFREANAQYYQSVDWALDIRELLLAGELEILDIPARLIRRDPESQIVITRERLPAEDDEGLSNVLSGLNMPGLWEWQLKHLRSLGCAEMVFVAPRADPRFKEWVDDLEALRKKGIALPD